MDDILPPTDDWIFKLLFGDKRNQSILIALLRSFVELPDEDFELEFMDTSLKPETEEDKLGILDIKVKTKTGKIIDVEIQVNPAQNIGNRLSFYKSKLIVEQIAKGEHYRVIEKVICVCITDYELFPRERDYLNRFRFYNPKNGLCFEEVPEEIYTLELPKLPARADGTAVWEWMQFLRSKRKEEFEMVAEKNPEIRKAVDTLYELSADERTRAEYEMHMRAVRDRAWLKDEGVQEGLRKGRQEGWQKGLQAGRQEGRQEGVQKFFELIKSGKNPDEAMAILSKNTPAQGI
jgi:predicted transposase/invertase (TIGR01784 family)